MAVTAVMTRNTHTNTTRTVELYCTAALTGTYATGGFTFNPFSITAGQGNSPIVSGSGTIISALFFSPTGYHYAATVAGAVVTVKIFSAPGTELANGAALPDATIGFTIVMKK